MRYGIRAGPKGQESKGYGDTGVAVSAHWAIQTEYCAEILRPRCPVSIAPMASFVKPLILLEYPAVQTGLLLGTVPVTLPLHVNHENYPRSGVPLSGIGVSDNRHACRVASIESCSYLSHKRSVLLTIRTLYLSVQAAEEEILHLFSSSPCRRGNTPFTTMIRFSWLYDT